MSWMSGFEGMGITPPLSERDGRSWYVLRIGVRPQVLFRGLLVGAERQADCLAGDPRLQQLPHNSVPHAVAPHPDLAVDDVEMCGASVDPPPAVPAVHHEQVPLGLAV